MRQNSLRRVMCLALCLLLLLPLTGCSGSELYERLLIQGIGVDLEGDGFLLTVRSAAAPGGESEELFHCRGKTVLEALDSLSLSTGRRPFYAHNYLVVFGADCARQGLDQCLDFFVRYYNTRPAVELFLAEGRAEEILAFEQESGLLKMSELQQMGRGSEESGFSLRMDVLDFVNGAHRKGSDPVLPVLRASERVELVGTACFEGFTLRSTLSPEETRGYLAAKNALRGGKFVLEGEEGDLTLSLVDCKGKITVERQGEGLPRFLLRAELTGDMSADDEPSLPGEPIDYAALEAALAETLRGEIETALEKTALDKAVDVFGFGNLLYRQEPAYWRSVEEDWRELLPQCGFQVEVSAGITRLETDLPPRVQTSK